MDHRSTLLGLALFLAYGSSYAGYTSAVPAGTYDAGAAKYVAGLADTYQYGRVKTQAVVNAGSKPVTIPAAMRFAPSASRVAAAAVFANPVVSGMMAAAVVGSAAYDAYQYFKNAKLTYDANAGWQKEGEKRFAWYNSPGTSKEAATAWACGLYGNPPGCTLAYNPPGQSNNWKANVITRWDKQPGQTGYPGYSYGIALQVGEEISPEMKPATQADMEQALPESQPLPDAIPKVLPKTIPWPVLPPVINPTAEPDPTKSPLPQPYRIPQGEPQAVPNTDPQQWKTPVVDVVPSPSMDDPWRVDVQPKDVTKTDPAPIPETTPTADPNSTATPKEQMPDLCRDHPEIIACQTLEFDTPAEDPLQQQEKQISITADTGWGSGPGACPAARHLTVANAEFSFQPICDFMTGFRPVLLAVSWLLGGMILVGARGGAAE